MRECSPLITCHISHVTFCSSYIFCIHYFGQRGEAIQGGICYQWGLPRLAFTNLASNLIFLSNLEKGVDPSELAQQCSRARNLSWKTMTAGHKDRIQEAVLRTVKEHLGTIKPCVMLTSQECFVITHSLIMV